MLHPVSPLHTALAALVASVKAQSVPPTAAITQSLSYADDVLALAVSDMPGGPSVTPLSAEEAYTALATDLSLLSQGRWVPDSGSVDDSRTCLEMLARRAGIDPDQIEIAADNPHKALA